MSNQFVKVNVSDVESLVNKLVQFDAELSDAERTIFRKRLLETLNGSDDVEGHAMELRWQSGDQGLFFQWINASEDGDSIGSPVDPSRWDTIRAGSSDTVHAPARDTVRRPAHS